MENQIRLCGGIGPEKELFTCRYLSPCLQPHSDTNHEEHISLGFYVSYFNEHMESDTFLFTRFIIWRYALCEECTETPLEEELCDETCYSFYEMNLVEGLNKLFEIYNKNIPKSVAWEILEHIELAEHNTQCQLRLREYAMLCHVLNETT